MMATAVAASLALAATLLLLPQAPWRVPLALLGGAWAPGFALVAAVWPEGRLTKLERHALALGLGVLVLPLAGLAVSEAFRFTPGAVGAALAALTCGLALLARGRAVAPEGAARSPLPSTHVTFWASGVALALAAMIALPPALLHGPIAPASLWVEGDAPRTVRPNGDLALVLVAQAGERAASGPLVVTWDGAEVWREDVALAPGEAKRVTVTVSVGAAGEHRLEATWHDRLVHLPIDARRGG